MADPKRRCQTSIRPDHQIGMAEDLRLFGSTSSAQLHTRDPCAALSCPRAKIYQLPQLIPMIEQLKTPDGPPHPQHTDINA